MSWHFNASKFWDEIRANKVTAYDFMGATLALTYKQKPNAFDRGHRVRFVWEIPISNIAEDYEKRFGRP
ncbi:uncharacterized protein Z518_10446 [Rhinocladiella mackenziei CBS 650.93]|uniref:Uncharacterized protein n=1 Tax=Rhinocladiella mackenziei CBS 650.93 TaxID=1442369 RepID=A0A0D2FDZ1_9EURO|nr:uncharacterized protein Z518_10446 [Rhinocladiella mackenziei CBS 650.93]KIX00307.1 hypothetical protein Z518_10446 [Rhinocladiella mackenziei CBS 650.93]